MGQISKDVIPRYIGQVIRIFWDNFLAGMVLTVSQFHPVLIYYSIVVYMIYLILLIISSKTDKDKKVFLFSAAVFIAVVFNVGLVSLVIFCQTRYTIYNMALFYIALIVMADAQLRKRKGARKKGS